MKKFLPLFLLGFAVTLNSRLGAASTEAVPLSQESSSSAPAVVSVSTSLPRIELAIVYPREGSKMAFVKNSFVLGSVHPPAASLSINGSTVPVYKTGSFSAFIPFTTGDFKIEAKAEWAGASMETLRNVFVNPPAETMPKEPLAIDSASIFPAFNVKLPSGERVPVRFRGSPEGEAQVRLKAKTLEGPWEPLQERPPKSGMYETTLSVPSSVGKEFSIECQLRGEARNFVRAQAEGKIEAADALRFEAVEVSTSEMVLRTGPSQNGDSMGYDLFLPRGVKLRGQGFAGTEVRIKISDDEVLWGDEKNLTALPEGSPVPSAILDAVRAQNKERSVVLSFDLKEKVPFRPVLSEDLKKLSLKLYYTISNLDRIRYDTGANPNWVDRIKWSQPQKETVEIQMDLADKVWGMDFRYEGSHLVCEIFFMPKLKQFRIPWKDLTIAVDPGHSLREGDGAVSPKGFKEGEVNFRIAECLKRRLEKIGAKVFMTRDFNESVSLADRGKRALAANSDLFVSVHTNAVPDGVNPLTRGGFSVFYFQPTSLELAKFVHSAFKKHGRMKDDGFYYGNLAVCRLPQIPSILTESAYLIRPDEEALLLDPDFQCQCAEAITQGIQKFIQSYQ